VVPGVPKAKVKSRIILTPEHAKRLLFALNLKSASKKLKEVVGVDFILFLHFSIQSNINTLAFE
jgi:ABC-type phosphate transport system auxiliary subunit